MGKTWMIICLLMGCITSHAQVPDLVLSPTIRSVQLYPVGNQIGYPILRMNSGEKLELHFDDLGTQVKNISYTWQLCNADWTPALLSPFDYLKGFTQQRIVQYRNSSVAFVRYIHYQAIVPEQNCMPMRSGNYLLRVFQNGDTAQTLFTRRVLMVQQQIDVGLQILQPFNGRYFTSHQKLNFTVMAKKIDLTNALQQVKVVLLQNFRWDNALANIRPTFIRQNMLEYNTEEDALFPGGKEWRWLNLRSFRLQSDRVEKADYTTEKTDIYVVPDLDRSPQRFVFYRDQNGLYSLEATESINYLTQADYARVYFRFKPASGAALRGKDVYVFGALSQYGLDPDSKMNFNPETGMYEASLLLKQGYYDYTYVTTAAGAPIRGTYELTEGNYWETENDYMVLVYYRPMGGRADELLGFARVNSMAGRMRN